MQLLIFVAMYLQSLSLVNFKNYSGLEVDFSEKINCFTGDNGVGKTNILDAIYYLSFCKSYFSASDALHVKHGDSLFVIEGGYNVADYNEVIYCGYEIGKKKKFKRNKKDYDRLADHIGFIPLVMISPADISLILGGSEERRKFIDGVISQFDREYLYNLQKYNKALLQRNHLLKEFSRSGQFDEDMLAIYNEQLVDYGYYIHKKREQFIEEIRPVFQKYFTHISLGKEEVTLNYNSQLSHNDYNELLQENLFKDRQLRYTSAGIHKDDIELLLGDYPMRKLGSQGQQKTYLVALKLAQFEYINKVCGFKPILLLDDVFDKLDSGRVEQIVKLVAQQNFGQIFITDTNLERANRVIRNASQEYYHFHIEDTKLERIYEES